jgi:hypothetical protein
MPLSFSDLLLKEAVLAWGEQHECDAEDLLASHLYELFGDDDFVVAKSQPESTILTLEVICKSWHAPFHCALDSSGHLSYERRPERRYS